MQDIIDKELQQIKRQQELSKYNDLSKSQQLNLSKKGLSYSNLYQAPPLTISSLYEDYSTGQISMLEALEKKDEIVQWSNILNSSQISSKQPSIIRKNLEDSIHEMNDQYSRKQRYEKEVMENISKESQSKYKKLEQNEKIYKDFKTALKLNISKVKQSDLINDIYRIDDLEPSKPTPRTDQDQFPRGHPILVKQELSKAGNFFFDQPVKDNKTFYFSNCFKDKDSVLKYLNDELKIREHRQSFTSYNQIKGIALKRLEQEIEVLREIIKGLLLNKIQLEDYNSIYYRFKLSLEKREQPKEVVNEFVLMFDFVNNLPFTVEKVRIKYGFFRRGQKHEANRTTNEHIIENEDGQCFIREIDKIIFPDKKLDHFIYFQILIFHHKQKFPENAGWSVHKIHNKSKLVDFGQFQIPFYEHRLELESVLLDYQKNIGPLRLFFSILPYNHEQEESPYRNQEYYNVQNYGLHEIHTEERIPQRIKNQVKKEKEEIQQNKYQRKRQFYEEAFKEMSLDQIESLKPSNTSLFNISSNKFSDNNTGSLNSNNQFNSSLVHLDQKEIDKFVRLSKDFNIDSSQILQSLSKSNQNMFTIQEENTQDFSHLM
ncbi:hypothetical protein TTHERM_00170150 (macronuclear) [Tetrahymena thermophila SB210]|uniref:Uncharacterized protein n=1 Tax=Tetrahymena thermophila (strain SB210) TaxID=312017 RepID=Q22TK8_TETTS|nr:hypothetical protein TTHERM_00170150 [Tetrahymena thermophila SB210]EAR88430.2 hypothetical protein TTHERM_00170150 [Tetrahymena thermophila SB210]|eukprot:XP_001008675.2 hypothetical protein TTHERM_00170150 [Tetrahymena thermophila SB210]